MLRTGATCTFSRKRNYLSFCHLIRIRVAYHAVHGSVFVQPVPVTNIIYFRKIKWKIFSLFNVETRPYRHKIFMGIVRNSSRLQTATRNIVIHHNFTQQSAASTLHTHVENVAGLAQVGTIHWFTPYNHVSYIRVFYATLALQQFRKSIFISHFIPIR